MAATVCPLCHTDLLLYTSSRRSIPVVPVGGNSEDEGWLDNCAPSLAAFDLWAAAVLTLSFLQYPF